MLDSVRPAIQNPISARYTIRTQFDIQNPDPTLIERWVLTQRSHPNINSPKRRKVLNVSRNWVVQLVIATCQCGYSGTCHATIPMENFEVAPIGSKLSGYIVPK